MSLHSSLPLTVKMQLTITCPIHLGPINANSSMTLLDLQDIDNINWCIHEITTHLKFKYHPLILPCELYISIVDEGGVKFEDSNTLERENGVAMEYWDNGNWAYMEYCTYEIGVCKKYCCVRVC